MTVTCPTCHGDGTVPDVDGTRSLCPDCMVPVIERTREQVEALSILAFTPWPSEARA